MLNKAIDLLQAATSNGINIVLNNGQLQLKVPKDKTIDPELLNEIKNSKQLLIDYLGNLRMKSLSVDTAHAIHPVQRQPQEPIRLSFAQERLWFVHQLQGSIQYHMPYVFRLQGQPDVDALEWAFRKILDRHEVLRSVIRGNDGLGYQIITDAAGWSLQRVHVTEALATHGSLHEYVQELVNTPFDLEQDPMLKVWVIQLAADEYMLVTVLHHIAFDGLSIGILVEELAELYSSRVMHRQPALKELPVQYADYAVWQRNYLSGQALSAGLGYWKQQLSGIEPLALPLDRSRQAGQGVQGAACSRMLDKDLLEALRNLSLREGATLFMTLLAAFKSLMYKYCGQQDICVGSPIAGRRQHEVEGLIGFFINTLVLRSQVQPGNSFKELLQQVKQTTLAAYEYQDVPFEKIVEALGIERDARRNPLYDVLFTLKEGLDNIKLDIGGLALAKESSGPLSAQFDINFNVIASAEGLQLHVIYAAALYDHHTIERMLLHYEQLLHSVVENSLANISDLRMLSAAETEQLVYGFNDTHAACPAVNVVSLFREQVLANPGATALASAGEELTYRQLDKRSESLANALRSKGVKAEMLVPICMERCSDMIISILAVLKAGGAYVPIDPAYPAARIEFILQDTAAAFVLTNSESAGVLPAGFQKLVVDKEWGQVGYAEAAIQPTQLAYIIYTSGSTGTPKGVMIEHGSLANYIINAAERYIDGKAVSFLHLPFTFDASVTSIFLPLVSGGTIVLPEKNGTAVFTDDLFSAYQPYDFLKLTPSHIPLLEQAMQQGAAPAKRLVVGGEALQPAHLRFLTESRANVTVINEYGPTEATVGCSVYSFNTATEECRTGENGLLIGKPLDNVQLYVVDDANGLAPIGVAGELCIGGAQLARGYWNQPALTKQKFIDNPFIKGEKVYKTGDIVRRLSDGNLEYLGRKDEQVKIRGYRIELGEVEMALSKAPGIVQAAVIVQQDSQQNNRLAGFINTDASYNYQHALQFLQATLPEYMVPSLLMEVNEIPLTANGKVDKKKLQGLSIEVKGQGEYVAPRNETEAVLAAIWQELLEIDAPGVHDDFFSLGGHSLLAIRVIAAIRSRFGKELGIKELFDHPTISGLAILIDGGNNAQALPSITRLQGEQNVPLSFSQERLWFIDKLHGSVQYHMPWVFRLQGELDMDALENAFATIVRRHEVLRTVIREQNGVGCQVVLPAEGWKITQLELNHQPIEELVAIPFDLANDFMLRVWLVKLSATEHLLITVFHHIAFDGWSIGVMVKELEELYKGHALPELAVQYSDYAAWQRNYLSGQVLDAKLGYWKNKLSGVEPLELPLDRVRPAIQSMRGAVVKGTIDSELAGRLQEISQSQGATLFMTLCSAFNILLYKYTGQQDICIGSPIAGRQQQETGDLIGFFVNTLVLRNEIKADQSFTEILQQVKQTTLNAYENQDVPFERIVEALGVQRDMSRTPVFQVMFALQNMPAADKITLGNVQLQPVSSGMVNAKFDLGLSISESAQGLQLEIIYCTDLFDETTVQAFLQHYTQLLRTIVKNISVPVSGMSMLARNEHRQLLQEFCNLTDRPAMVYSLQSNVGEQLKSGGSKIAIEYKDRSITYDELQARIGQFNWFLRKKLGLAKGSRVAVLLNRSEKLVISMLALMRSGLVYVPIDNSYPEDRVKYMLQDSQASLVLADGNTTVDLTGFPVITTDEIFSATDTGFFEENIDPADDAYIMYTSGSTGRPKGVVITHGNLDYLFECLSVQYRYDGMVLPFTASHSFDVSIVQIYLPLLLGGKILVTDREQLQDLGQLVAILERGTMIDTVPGLFKLIVTYIEERGLRARFTHIQQIFVGGDVVPDDLLIQLAEIFPNAVVSVMYGPTEGTVFCIGCPHSAGAAAGSRGTVIGRPLGRAQIYIVGKSMELVPPGVDGEICIGGPGVAKGYLNQPEQTAQKFIEDPFQPGNMLYRTGDVGRWTRAGLVDFKGRNDNQVKIRGNRIEPGELENKLKEVSGINEAVVVVVKKEDGDMHLAAFYTGVEITRPELEFHLSKSFSSSVLPSHYIHIDAVPLTPNDKVDRKKLQQLAAEMAHHTKEYVAPRNETERGLANVWQELLGVEQVSIHDNFFELGGHSLLAIRMIAAIRAKLGLEVTVRSLFSNPTVSKLAAAVSGQSQATVLPIEKYNGQGPAPLSFAQERLWFIDRLQGSVQYHLPWVFRLKGALDADLLEQSFRKLLQRHEVLRTVITEEDGTGYQVVTCAPDWQMQRIDAAAIQGSLQQYAEGLLNIPFNLSSDAMLKAWLLKISETEHVLVLLLHHIAADAWSMGILASELTELYCSAAEGRDAQLKELPVQYRDYAVWQRNYLSGEVLGSKLSYWKNKLQHVQPLDLITDHARPAVQSTQGAVVSGRLGREAVNALEELSRGQGATLFMTLLSAFKVLLHKYTGQHDICVGTPIAGRQQQEVEGLIGFFVNTLALRNEVDEKRSFKELLQQVKQTTLEAYDHQEVPFEKIVEALGVQRDMSRTPVFQVMFSLQNAPQGEALNWSQLTLETEKTARATAQFDINLSITPHDGECSITLIYAKSLFAADTMSRMLKHYCGLLNSVLVNADASVEAIELPDEVEKQQLLHDFNDTAVAYPQDKTVVDLFVEQARNTPGAVAVVFEDEQLTYRELDELSNQLAHLLVSKGVGSETLVPVCLDRSLDMLVVIFGIWKAGAAYVPIDPLHPVQRIQYMLEDCGATLAVCHKGYEHFFADTVSLEDAAVMPATPIAKAGALSYLIYTSGSTGQPKGVMIEHRSLLNFLLSMQFELELNAADKTIALTTYSFDISCLELYLGLICGATVHIGQLKDGYALKKLVEKVKPTYMQATPSGWQLLLESGWQNESNTTILTGGEAIPDALKEALTSISSNVFNMYGPTETTIWSAMHRLHKGKKVSIGTPIANTKIYILNSSLQPCPIGVPGELCIGGDGLSRGYLNKPELTAEKFIDNPFIKGEKIYKTGDVARWNADGTLEFLGRKDEQVKVRGYRIELGEIETVLNRVPGIQQAVVVAVKDQLVAYAIKGFDKAAVISYLRQFLPEYMVPSLLFEVTELPLTPNGKVDRKKLRELELTHTTTAYEAPRNATEQALTDIWQELLNITKLSIHDNFFESGGHSLLAMRMVSMVRKRLGKEIAIKEIFLHPTIAQLSRQVENQNEQLIPVIERYEKPGLIPLSFSQERLWFIDKLQGSLQYHMPYVFRMKGNIDAHALEASFREILNRHEVLRTIIAEEDGKGYQQILPADGWKMNHATQQDIEQLIATPFDLANDFMLKVWLIPVSPVEHILVALVHHIAFDGWSIRVVVDELAELYSAQVEQRTPALNLLPVQYADYAIWQRNYLKDEVLDKKLAYWKQQLHDITPLELPTDNPRPAVQSTNGAVIAHKLDENISAQLQQLCQQEGVTIFMALLGAFNILLHKYSGQPQICVGSPIAGRNQQELENLVGFFINTIPLRTSLDGGMSFAQLLQQVKQTTLDAYDHQDVPFEKIVEALDIPRDMSRTPVFQVMFMLQNLPHAGTLKLGDVNLEAVNAGPVTAKFDITVAVHEAAESIYLDLTYCTALYERSTMERMLRHYEQLLRAVLENKNATIASVDMLGEAEQQELLYRFNNTAVAYPDATVLSLFQFQVQSNPSAIALACRNEKITYAALDDRSARLACYLKGKGVQQGTLVPVLMDRSIDMIVSMLAVLKAGAAYVPVDPAYPQQRIDFILSDTRAAITLSTKEYAKLLPAGVTSIAIDAEWPEILRSQPAAIHVHSSQLAYIIYTSGSTGNPKGVMIEHRSLANYLLNSRSRYIAEGAGTFFHLPFTFDASVTSIFVPLISGKAIHIGTAQGAEAFSDASFNPQQCYDFIKLTPAHLRLLEAVAPEQTAFAKNLVVGGEALHPAHFNFLVQQKAAITIINEYGPTEATVGCAVYSFNTADNNFQTGENGVLIGRPLDNVQLYVFDQYNKPAPVGVYGELCIAGVQVARGYLNQPELTRQKFIDNPFVKGQRMYRSGDIARWLPDGNLEYAGRKDEQVKIKGYRIELGEVEAALHDAPGVLQAAVTVQEDIPGNKRLIGYVVAAESFSKEIINNYLLGRLPEYMAPSALVQVSSIPLTANGKVDRKKLQELAVAHESGKEHTAAVSEAEQALAAIWQELLGIEEVSVHDNFFELGGDSIITIQVVSRMKRKGYELKPKDLFQHQTIAKLAAIINAGGDSTAIRGEQGLLQGASGLLPIQQWYFENASENISHYNQSIIVSIGKHVEATALDLAIKHLMERHDALRFSYQRTANGWQQEYSNNIISLQVEDLHSFDGRSFAQAVKELGDRYHRNLDIEKGRLAQMVLVKSPVTETYNRLLMIVHHLAIDGVSWRILLEDLSELLNRHEAGMPLQLGEKGASYRQWYNALATYGAGNSALSQAPYWNSIIERFTPLPVDISTQEGITQKDYAHCTVVLSKTQTQQLLQEIPKVYHTEVNDVLLAALARTLSQWSGHSAIVIGLEGHGREEIIPGLDLGQTAGWFTTMFPVLIELEGLNTEDELLKGAKEQLRLIPAKGIGYGVLRYINREPSLQGRVPWEIIFNYLGQTGNALGNKWFEPAPESSGSGITDAWKPTNKMEVISVVDEGELRVRWNYSTRHYYNHTIETLSGNFISNLETLIAHCMKRAGSGPVFTPADYGLSSDISFKELDAFLEKNDPGLEEVMSF